MHYIKELTTTNVCLFTDSNRTQMRVIANSGAKRGEVIFEGSLTTGNFKTHYSDKLNWSKENQIEFYDQHICLKHPRFLSNEELLSEYPISGGGKRYSMLHHEIKFRGLNAHAYVG